MKKRKESQGNQDIVKHSQDRRQPVNGLIDLPQKEPGQSLRSPRSSKNDVRAVKAEGNIYQHARKSIEGDVHRLVAQLGAYFGAYDLRAANPVRRQGVAFLERRNHRRRGAVRVSKVAEIGEHAARIAVAIIKDAARQFVVAAGSGRAKVQGIL